MKQTLVLCLLLTGCSVRSPRVTAFPVPPACVVVTNFPKPCVKQGNKYKCQDVEVSIKNTPGCKGYDLNTISVEVLRKVK